MKSDIPIQFVAATICFLLASPALAQDTGIPCGPRDALSTKLREGWGETSIITAYGPNGAYVEFFGKIDGSWTLILVRPDGWACPLTSGLQWQGFMIPQGEAG